jgi:rhodanese-related sulfurtransferase
VVDLRSRQAFAAGHLGGTLNFGLDGQFVTYLGWLIPWQTPVTLLGETPEQVAEAQRDMARIGMDKPVAMATGKPEEWAGDEELRHFPTATFADLKTALQARAEGREDFVLLDVRRAPEHDESHIEGAVNLPIHTVPAHLDDVPRRRLWVHCAGGYRAGVVAALLAAHGHDVVAVDDSYAGSAAAAGLPLVSR